MSYSLGFIQKQFLKQFVVVAGATVFSSIVSLLILFLFFLTEIDNSVANERYLCKYLQICVNIYMQKKN